MRYEEPYITADLILNYYGTIHTRLADSQIISHFRANNYSTDKYSQAIDTMVSDGYIIQENNNSIYRLLGGGTQLILNGGYKVKIERDNKEEADRKEDKRVERELMISSKDTNESVQTTNTSVVKNIRQSTNLFWLTFSIAVLGVVFPALTYLNDTEKRELKTLLKDTTKYTLQIQILQDSLKYVRTHPSSDTTHLKKSLNGKK